MSASHGAWTLARLLAGLPADPHAIPADWPLYDILQRVANANGRGPPGAFRDALEGRDDAAEIIALINSIDPNAPAPTPGRSKAARIPELPTAARPDPSIAADAGSWLDSYVSHARSVSPMTPRSFHESAALWLGATTIARRLIVPMSFSTIYPNLFICWIAPTTIFGKTTAMAVPRGIAFELFPHLLAPQEMTPEAFLSDLAGLEPAKADTMSPGDAALWHAERNFAGQRSLLMDEGSGLLASAGRDYNAGLLEAFLRLYDCDPRYSRSTRSQGRVTVHKAYLSILMASTPKAMASHLGSDRLWSMGWWPRFALLTPETDRPAWEKPTASGPPGEHIRGPLRQLYERLPVRDWPEVAPSLSVMLGKGVFEKWDAFNKVMRFDLLGDDLDERLFGTYGRMPVQVMKIATILAAFDWKRDDHVPRIDLPHLHRAIEIAEAWRLSAHRTIEKGAVAEENVKLSRLLRQIGRYGLEGATLRDLRLGMRDVPLSDLKRLVEGAETSGDIEAVEPTGPRARGRPAVRYRITLE